ncbi:hypothetical protein PMAYCL1PPCAC_11706 [Pristionchus mayeri]|uniref:Galectin n=1 Tax=Pristionchus mayeri TaxID=1317129 RepID=A0AAN5CGG5_9BILA|nr:hypothetical protein PMAYCL1PPCAC_11706 [Pristionchus mayeri]
MDIPFHFNPRFEHKVVVRNHAVKGEWNFEMEERSGGFPFKRNEIFTLEFVSRKGHIQVSTMELMMQE